MSSMTTETKDSHGLGGWLVLVGINVVFSPVILLRTLYQEYTEILSTEAWILQTTPGSSLYHPLFKTLIIAEVMLNVFLLFMSLYLVQQFFTKKQIFPRVYSIILILSVVLLISDALVIKLIFPQLLVLTPEAVWHLIRATLSALIIVPYLRLSKRVKLTFIY